MCVLDYDFLILDNAFLVHKPGIKTIKKDGNITKTVHVKKQNKYLKNVIMPELYDKIGTKEGCVR